MKKVEISKSDLKNNLDIIKSKLSAENKIIAVVKANGMGLGLVEYSKFLIDNQVDILAVANSYEAIKLRENEVKSPILMLTPVNEYNELKELINKNIILTVDNKNNISLIESIANELNRKVEVHVKIDTGFARYGFLYDDIKNIIDSISNLNMIQIKGVYTHFSNPKDEKWTKLQFSRFLNVIEELSKNNITFEIKHCCASTAFLKYPEMILDAIRVGSVLQGRTISNINGLKKIGICKTIVNEIKDVPKGYNISYTNTYKTKKDTKIAVIPVGYMDGFNRNNLRDDFSFKNNIISVFMELKKIFKENSLKVSINDNSYKVIGRLGMYHSIIDITDSDNIKVGDEVILDMKPLQADIEIRREYI